jgi:hypothetical protein
VRKDAEHFAFYSESSDDWRLPTIGSIAADGVFVLATTAAGHHTLLHRQAIRSSTGFARSPPAPERLSGGSAVTDSQTRTWEGSRPYSPRTVR